MLPTIASSSNPHVKRIKKLLSSTKFRREEDLAVAEGIHLVQSYLQSDSVPSEYVYAESALENPEIKQIIEQLDQASIKHLVLADNLFSSISSVHASVGIMMIFKPARPIYSFQKITNTAVLLEDIQDPGNIGAILRVVAAVGVRDVFLSANCASTWSPKALRSGMGAQFSLNLYEENNSIELVKKINLPAVVTTLSVNSKSLYDTDLSKPVLWIFGNEGQGVNCELIDLSPTHLSIPQAENSVESLNVATAAAVCLYEQYRQNL